MGETAAMGESAAPRDRPTIPAGLPARLFAPVDISFLAYFRVIYGLMMLMQCWYYIGATWIEEWFHQADYYYVRPDFHFSYYGFAWVKPLPELGMHLLFVLLGLLSVCIALGLFYRTTSLLFCLGYTYTFLLDKACYNNHFYLFCLISLLMSLLPAAGRFSIDAWRNPALSSEQVPAWMLWLLRIQIGIPYFYGGIAKINHDWLRGEPMRKWIFEGSPGLNYPFLKQEAAIWFISYGGLMFDLLIVPLLIYRRTRVFAFLAAVVFNLCNSQLFTIGVFPWFMLLATLIFFSPDWPRRAIARMSRMIDWAIRTRIPFFNRISPLWIGSSRSRTVSSSDTGSTSNRDFESKFPQHQRRGVLIVLSLYLGFQLLWPFRHHLYPGDPAWTGKGDLFAWRMMLYDKSLSEMKFYTASRPADDVSDRQVRRTELPAKYLNETLNYTQISFMTRDPDLLLQFSHYLAKRLRRPNGEPAEIYSRVLVSYNSRAPQLLIDPEVNLTTIPRTLFGPTDWIMPFEQTPLIGPQQGMAAE